MIRRRGGHATLTWSLRARTGDVRPQPCPQGHGELQRDHAPRAVATVLVLASLTFAAIGGCRPGTPPAGSSAPAGSRDLLTLAEVERNAEQQVVSIKVFGSDISDAEVGQIAQYPTLESLTLQECRSLTNAGMQAPGQHPALRSLSVINIDLDDTGLAHLGASTSLESLLLGQTKVAGSGLAELANTPLAELTVHSRIATTDELAALTQLTGLRQLELHCPQVRLGDLPSFAPLKHLASLIATRTPAGPNGLDPLRDHPSLQIMELNAEGLGDASLATLNTIPSLREVTLIRGDMTNDGLQHLAMPNLRSLALIGCLRITDKGLAHLSGLPSLERLDLTESGVTGEDLTGLGAITTLREVILSGTQFRGNDASLAALKALLPECQVQILRG